MSQIDKSYQDQWMDRVKMGYYGPALHVQDYFPPTPYVVFLSKHGENFSLFLAFMAVVTIVVTVAANIFNLM